MADRFRKHGIAALMCVLTLSPLPALGQGGPREFNVVLVVVDALRADHMGVYGYFRNTTPHIDAWARSAIVFSSAIAQANWTLPSLASLMTSQYPSVHGATAFPREDRWAIKLASGSFHPASSGKLDARLTLAEALRQRGYYCGGFVSGAFPRAEFGFNRGFDIYSDLEAPLNRLRLPLEFIAKNRDRRFFLYLHTIDAHSPYDKGEKFNRLWDADYCGQIDGSGETLVKMAQKKIQYTRRDIDHLIALYDGAVSYMDEHLSGLLRGLDDLGLSGKTVVVITSDHGEAFMEHGQLQHGGSPYEELLRVPLMMRIPSRRGARIDGVVRSIDIFPTILDILGFPAPPGLQGTSLLPMIDGRPGEKLIAFSEATFLPFYDRFAAVLRTDRWKYIYFYGDRREELYDLGEDEGEANNLIGRRPELAKEFRRRMELWEKDNRKARARLPPIRSEMVTPDASARESLQRMGYLK